MKHLISMWQPKKTAIFTARAIHKLLLIYIHTRKNEWLDFPWWESPQKFDDKKFFVRKWIPKKYYSINWKCTFFFFPHKINGKIERYETVTIYLKKAQHINRIESNRIQKTNCVIHTHCVTELNRITLYFWMTNNFIYVWALSCFTDE